ncbi:Transposase [Leptolyngbya sp. PCC 7375]|nr:Transposase [Leptolyngbya sp. PCC 7375]
MAVSASRNRELDFMTTKVVGCDCGKSSLYVCVIEKKPRNFKQFARSYKPEILKISQDSIDYLLGLDADTYVLEPTGSYGYIWIDQLTAHGKDVRLVSPRRVTAYRVYQGVTNKQDRPDAAAIACYSFENYDDPSAFISLDKIKFRQKYLSLKNTINNRSPIHNRLCQRLTFECPELVKTVEKCARSWLDPNPPATIRAIAGQEVKGPWSTLREEKIANTIGRGISAHSKFLANQLCSFYEEELRLEEELDALIYQEKLRAYNSIFDKFEVAPKTRAALLSAIFPFEAFLDDDGKEIIEYVSGKKGQSSRRNRSEAAFKLSLGMGLVFKESGKKRGWIKGGPRYLRAILWTYVSTTVVIGGESAKVKKISTDVEQCIHTLGTQKTPHWLNGELVNAIATITDTTREVASLRLHYKFARPGEPDFKRRMATASRFVRQLYKALVKEIAKR